MSKPLISFSEFAQVVADEEEERFTRADLGRFDYDAPKERVALVSWCDERVDEFGEVFEGFWRVIMAGDGRRWSELHDWGVLHFGEPPWRRSQVVRVFGRLGSVEAAVAELAKPGPDFAYAFDLEAPVPAPVARRVGGPSRSAPRSAAGAERRFRRAVRPDRPRQGELF